MSSTTVNLLAAATALVATIVVGAIMIRTRRASEMRLTHGMLDMGYRLDALARELSQTIEKVQEDALRTRITGTLGQALDLDEVITRCAEAAVSLPGVAAAAVTVEVDGTPLVAAVGLDSHLIEAIAGPPDGSPLRAVGLSYHYLEGRAESGAMLSAVAVPLETEGQRLGFLTVFGRTEEPPVAGTDFRTLETIAQATGAAIEKARLISVRRLPEGDGLTRLGNRQLLHETLALEVARAHRHKRRLAVCVLDIDDFKATNGRVGHVAGDRLLVEIADLVRETIRPGDLAYRSGGDEFAVVMPASGRIDAEATFARLQASLRRRPPAQGPALSLSAGIAELKPDDDGISLFERAERALHRAKEAGKGTAA